MDKHFATASKTFSDAAKRALRNGRASRTVGPKAKGQLPRLRKRPALQGIGWTALTSIEKFLKKLPDKRWVLKKTRHPLFQQPTRTDLHTVCVVLHCVLCFGFGFVFLVFGFVFGFVFWVLVLLFWLFLFVLVLFRFRFWFWFWVLVSVLVFVFLMCVSVGLC